MPVPVRSGRNRHSRVRRQRWITGSRVLSCLFAAGLLLGLPTDNFAGQQAGVHYPNIPGELLLENDKVIVQKFTVEPGEFEGLHTHPGNQIYVHIKGGEWTVRRGGRENVSQAEDGSVGFYGAIGEEENHESGNSGDTPIELVWVTLKDCTVTSNHSVGTYYPDIPSELLLENERAVVQRFIVEPGQWEGVHSHPGDQVYVHVRGGVWSGRRNGQERIGTDPSEAGSAGWMDAVDFSEGHNSGNTGDTPIELIWITLKPCTPA